MQDIIENVEIIYVNGTKEIYDAISITDKGVYTGKIKTKNQNIEEFVNHSFIPRDQIKKIIFFNNSGRYEDINFQKSNKVKK
jgi:hypothetical protein